MMLAACSGRSSMRRRVTVQCNADAGTSSHSAKPRTKVVCDYRRETLMQLESLLKLDRCAVVFEAIGDDKVRVNCSTLDDSKGILADQAL